MNIQIREFVEKDAEEVFDVALKSWIHTYSHLYDEGYILGHIEEFYSPEALLESLKDPEKSCLFVADDEGKVIGFVQPCLYKYWDPESFDPSRMMISRMYIDPSYIGRGVGSLLLSTAEKYISGRGFNEYYLWVHKMNKLGLSFYSRKGFTKVEEVNNEILLKKVLNTQ